MKNLDYLSADIDSPLAMIRMDITDINAGDGEFDCIICYHVLEHVQEDRKAMGELFRILKPGGWAVLTTPLEVDRETTYEDPAITSPEARADAYGHPEHVRVYGMDFRDRLAEAGFEVTFDGYAAELPDDKVERFRISRREMIHFCRKPGA